MNFTFLCYWLTANLAWSEYRVFLLQMVTAEGKVTKEFPSTLDPLQYPSYYPMPKGIYLQYTKTWMCWDSTAEFKKLCPDPAATTTPVVPAGAQSSEPAKPTP